MTQSIPFPIQGTYTIPSKKDITLLSDGVKDALYALHKPFSVVAKNNQLYIAQNGSPTYSSAPPSDSQLPLVAHCPALSLSSLGSSAFKNRYQLRYPYVLGAMANAITSVEMVRKAGENGMLGFFGAGGLNLDVLSNAADQLFTYLPNGNFGFNLLHNPNEPNLEMATVELYLQKNIRHICASAYLNLSLPLVRYRVSGIYEENGAIICPHKVIGKVSRLEVATRFLSPPPQKMLSELVAMGHISPTQARLATHVSMADDITAEADSGGHTDNRSALSLFPAILELRNQLSAEYNYPNPPTVGLGGGIATPWSAAAAFEMGAAYVLTGSVNQACTEAGTSEIVRNMLAEADQTDVTMAPAADMFEMGVKLQVLKRGTMFAQRADRLFQIYKTHSSIENIEPGVRKKLEEELFRANLDDVWIATQDFFARRDPRPIERAQKDPKYKMALIFRSYLGQASGWAIQGNESRRLDYQIWTGPSIGAFNQWCRTTYLAAPENRHVIDVAFNILVGAAVWMRYMNIILQGAPIPSALLGGLHPISLDLLKEKSI